ncbi:group II truncated hemoglobin [Shewanella woodyi]|uniref:group II truncated hemoglobin n=1 Tax=Shewanella woodyi TaxID=60961 RepID=UPI0037487A19
MTPRSCEYGVGDNSYKMAGELAGLTQLVDEFYNNMDEITGAKKIRDMHPADLTESRQKLVYFLSGWLGGPRLYREHYGPISIPKSHQHLHIGLEESEAWLSCMEKAVAKQPYEAPFKLYLMEQLQVPAQRIRQVSSARKT